VAAVDVSVLIPVLNEERHLRAAVARMLAQDHHGQVEFLFIDGGSEDASRGILAELAAGDERIRVLENPHRRTPQALNIGLRAARGEFVARMDAHAHYPPDYLSLGVERLRRGGAEHVSGPALAAAGDGAGWRGRIALALRTPLGVGGADFRRSSDAEFEVDTGFAGLWRRELLLEHGGWDEGWPTDQDCELAFRLSAAGARHVCLPAMAADYLPRDSLAALWRQYWQFGLHKTKTFNRHPAAMRPSHLLPPAAALTVGAAVAPTPLRRPARAATAVYAATLVAGAAQTARKGAPARDVAALPLVYAVMHLSYGFGLLAGARRYGVPTAAVAGAVRRALRRP
jgi:succinoglycan biosynthesis protein ExoA